MQSLIPTYSRHERENLGQLWLLSRGEVAMGVFECGRRVGVAGAVISATAVDSQRREGGDGRV